MSWICSKCKDIFYNREEVVFLCGDIEVEREELGGSGDIDVIYCVSCYEEEMI